MDPFQAKLFQRINYERQTKSGSSHFKLRNLTRLLQRLGDPHLAYPVIHVAGTKGKGSTSKMIASLLTEAGLKTGIYTSPHLESVHQRIAIDGIDISNGDLERVLEEMEPHLLAVDGDSVQRPTQASEGSATLLSETQASTARPLTFFEVITATAMQHFAQQQCEAVVLEVGMGGRLDSTNVCQPDVCVITNISLDHTRQLGSTIEKIAFEKAGIIKPEIPVVCGAHQKTVRDVVQEVADKNQAPVRFWGRDFQITSSAGSDEFTWSSITGKPRTLSQLRLQLLGQHQQMNASLAIDAALQLAQRLPEGQLKLTDEVIRRGLLRARFRGRTEVVQDAPKVILDIAHNEASIEALLKTLQESLPGWETFSKRTVIFASSKDKDIQTMVDKLVPHFGEFVATEFTLNPRSADAAKIAEFANARVVQSELETKVLVQVDAATAWRQVFDSSGANDLICVAGSAFLIAEVRPLVVAE